MRLNHALKLGLGLACAGFFVWLVLRHLDLATLWQTMQQAQSAWLLVALLCFLLGYACRIERWRRMLRVDNPSLCWRDCSGPLLASFAANNVLPFRAGDLIRAFAFNRQLGSTSGIVIATLLVERLLDLLMVLLFLGLALSLFDIDSSQLLSLSGVLLLGCALVILAILLFPGMLAPPVRSLSRLARRWAPGIGDRLADEVDKSLNTLMHLAQGSTMLKLVFWSFLAWLGEGLVFLSVAFALPSITEVAAAWLALPVGTLATLIPSTPGYIGTFDFFTMRSMTELGNSQLAATAYALIVHMLLWLPPTLIGGVYLLLHPIKNLHEIRKRAL